MSKTRKTLRLLAITLGILASIYCFLFVNSFAGLNIALTAHAGNDDTDLTATDVYDYSYDDEDDYSWAETIAKQKTIVIDKEFVQKYDTYIGTASRKGVFCALMWALSEQSDATEIKVMQSDFPVIKDEDGRKRRLAIYSNKHLDLGGATLQRSSTENVIVTGDPDAKSQPKQYTYTNISISNGIINGGTKSQGVAKFARVDGLTLDNLTFTSIGKHAAEFAAVKNVKITNCTFEKPNYKVKSIQSGYEALSFDMTSNDNGFPKYAPGDYLPCCNMEIRNCTFDGVFRGLGSHHYKNKVFYENITVENCVFKNIQDTAIQSAGWKNAKIRNNTMDRVGFGIDFKQPVYSLVKTKKWSAFASKSVVENNTIKVRYTGTKTAHYGIRVGGFSIPKSIQGLKPGDYYMKSFTIKNNKISGKCHSGISVEYAKNCTITGNSIKGFKNGKAINIVCSDKLKISGNKTGKK